MALWTPSSISTTAWYDANVSASVTVVSGFVTAWLDQSGNSKDLTPTSAVNLVYSATSLSTSKPGITFDGTAGFQNTSMGVASGTKVTAFAAAQLNTANAAGSARICGICNTAGFDFNCAIPILRNSATAYIYTFNGPAADPQVTTNVAFIDSGMAYGAGTTFENRLNGTSQGTQNATYPAFSGDKMGIGYALDGSGSPWGGVISEVVVITTDPTANATVNEGTFALYNIMEGYLAWKWGTQASLPGGHAFAAGAPTIGSTDTFLGQACL